MKYNIFISDMEERETEIILNMRSDASDKTIIKRAIKAAAETITENGWNAGPIRYEIEKPNIWTNGGVYGIWIDTGIKPLFQMFIVSPRGTLAT